MTNTVADDKQLIEQVKAACHTEEELINMSKTNKDDFEELLSVMGLTFSKGTKTLDKVQKVVENEFAYRWEQVTGKAYNSSAQPVFEKNSKGKIVDITTKKPVDIDLERFEEMRRENVVKNTLKDYADYLGLPEEYLTRDCACGVINTPAYLLFYKVLQNKLLEDNVRCIDILNHDSFFSSAVWDEETGSLKKEANLRIYIGINDLYNVYKRYYAGSAARLINICRDKKEDAITLVANLSGWRKDSCVNLEDLGSELSVIFTSLEIMLSDQMLKDSMKQALNRLDNQLKLNLF